MASLLANRWICLLVLDLLAACLAVDLQRIDDGVDASLLIGAHLLASVLEVVAVLADQLRRLSACFLVKSVTGLLSFHLIF